MSFAIGIDLGTTNSAAAVYRRGKVESIPIDGRKILPSVISVRDNGQILVGQSAKSRLYIDPQNSIASAKRFMGDKTKSYDIYGRPWTPIDAAAEILKKIRAEASKYLGEEVRDAVITIPAYFTEEQREATRQAGQMAGLNVLRLLPEPTAAAIAYGLDKERDQTIMVYDLGGGTFDVSILKVEGNHFRVLAVDGNSTLGGDDFDDAIVAYVLEQSGIRISSEFGVEGSIARQRLKEAAEQAKIELSESDIVDITLPEIYGTHIEEELSLERYNQLIQPLLDATLAKMADVMNAAGLSRRDISRVIMVGGSTRNRAVREMITQQVKQPFIADNVDEIVAHGAAILAANLGAPDLDNAPALIDVQDVTAHSFGINLFEKGILGNLKEFIKHLIPKNTTLPCTGATIAETLYKHQRNISFGVYRTESREPNAADKLGELNIPVSDQSYHVPAVALFELDEDGILTFSSAELQPNSPLVKSFLRDKQVDIGLLYQMIQAGEIRPEQVKIDTK